MAPAGHACAQAVVNESVGTITSPEAPAFTFCAILAHHRVGDHLRIINPGLVLLFPIRIERLEEILFPRAGSIIAIDAQPVHFASALDLLLADDRDVILTLASQHARRTPDAQVQ